ncbi:MAG: aspartate aminotransferase family protein [Gammaproteobacteria bacterium]|nr:aspartate aminotransferase family protein [Gammaproteobacteria bacterium]
MATDNHLMPTYGRLPVNFTHGKGAWLWDTDGKRYLDAMAGVAVNGLGHAHEAVVQAVCAQARRVMHVSNWYQIDAQAQLGDKLCAIASMNRVFFGNSGAEANEAAIKLARLYGHKRGIDNPAIVVMEGSFHGRTLATLSATGNRKVQAGFEPLVTGFRRVPYNDLAAIRQVREHDQQVVAVLVEPVLGEGGIHVPDPGYLTGIRQLCDEAGWLMMLDEIQTGMGRTGRWFGWQHEGARPDVMTVAKALGNGIPIGACLAQGPAAELFQPGNHGSTFGGNPLAATTALAVIGAIEQAGLVERATVLGERIRTGLAAALEHTAGVREVRGLGLMIGIELDRPAQGIMMRALDKGLLLNTTAERVVRLLPPLILSDDEAARVIDLTAMTIIEHLQS